MLFWCENISCSVMSARCSLMDCSLPGSSVHGDSPGKNTGVGYHSLLQGIFLIQGSNLNFLYLLHWQADSLPFSSVQFSRSVVSTSLWPHELQHAMPPCPSPTPGVHPNSCPLSRWCYPTISPSVVPLSSCLQSFPASGSFQMSQLFTSGGQNIGVSASTYLCIKSHFISHFWCYVAFHCVDVPYNFLILFFFGPFLLPTWLQWISVYFISICIR